jgi:hypothetical protein
MRRTGWVVLAFAAIMVVTGCEEELTAAPAGGPAPTAPSPTTETLEPTVPTDDAQPDPGQPRDPSPPPGARQPASSAVPAPYLEAVIADAARRAGVPADRVEVTRAQSVQWRDGSLGCPEPDMMYTQAIVDGYWVELEAAGSGFDYRLDGEGRFRLCQQPDRSPPYTTDR